MMKMKIAVSLFLFYILGIQNVFSCSCFQESDEINSEKSKSVEIVTVLGAEVEKGVGSYDKVIYEFDRHRSLKGDLDTGLFTGSASFSTSNDGGPLLVATCGSPQSLVVGQTYKIFNEAYFTHTEVCNPNMLYNIENERKLRLIITVGVIFFLVLFFFLIRFFVKRKKVKSEEVI